jgi:hypothetical protein
MALSWQAIRIILHHRIVSISRPQGWQMNRRQELLHLVPSRRLATIPPAIYPVYARMAGTAVCELAFHNGLTVEDIG